MKKHDLSWRLLALFFGSICLSGCNDDESVLLIAEGNYTHQTIQLMNGFDEEKPELLSGCQVDETAFIALSTDSAWALPADQRQKLRSIRDGVSKPDGNTLLQKIIPLSDLTTYMENKYGGTVGGFVTEAADVKSLFTMRDVYYGLRLDYEGTQFKPEGAGYAVIRFYSEKTDKLDIPYSPELGGNQEHAWPNGGGGFTTSTLGKGGYPEWTFDNYYAPKDGAELYEVTPQGREILRSVYKEGKWQTYESEYYPLPETKASAMSSGKVYNGVFASYKGYRFMVKGEADGLFLLATYTAYPIPGLSVLEKGVYGLLVPTREVVCLSE